MWRARSAAVPAASGLTSTTSPTFSVAGAAFCALVALVSFAFFLMPPLALDTLPSVSGFSLAPLPRVSAPRGSRSVSAPSSSGSGRLDPATVAGPPLSSPTAPTASENGSPLQPPSSFSGSGRLDPACASGRESAPVSVGFVSAVVAELLEALESVAVCGGPLAADCGCSLACSTTARRPRGAAATAAGFPCDCRLSSKRAFANVLWIQCLSPSAGATPSVNQHRSTQSTPSHYCMTT